MIKRRLRNLLEKKFGTWGGPRLANRKIPYKVSSQMDKIRPLVSALATVQVTPRHRPALGPCGRGAGKSVSVRITQTTFELSPSSFWRRPSHSFRDSLANPIGGRPWPDKFRKVGETKPRCTSRAKLRGLRTKQVANPICFIFSRGSRRLAGENSA